MSRNPLEESESSGWWWLLIGWAVAGQGVKLPPAWVVKWSKGSFFLLESTESSGVGSGWSCIRTPPSGLPHPDFDEFSFIHFHTMKSIPV